MTAIGFVDTMLSTQDSYGMFQVRNETWLMLIKYIAGSSGIEITNAFCNYRKCRYFFYTCM
jgi:hypothetical protein